MGHSCSKWLKLYTVGNILYTLAWGLYFTSSRIYVKEFLGGTYTDITLLTSLEFIPALFSTLWGYLGDVFGRRKMILIGFLSVPAFSLIGFTELPWVFILAFIASLSSTIAWPSIVSAVVSDIEYTGSKKYSIYAIGGSIGWGLGSLLMGFLYALGGIGLISIVIGLSIGASFIIFYALYPKVHVTFERKELKRNVFSFLLGSKVFLAFLVAVAVSYFGLEFSYNILSIKLYNELGRNEILYGIFFGGITAFLGALFRPLAGKIVDNVGEVRSFMLTLICYTSLLYGLASAQGWIMALLWIIPVYPLYDTSAVTVSSKSLPPEFRATAFGSYGTATSIAGSLVVLAGPLADTLGVNKATIFSSALQIVALFIIIIAYLKFKRKKYF